MAPFPYFDYENWYQSSKGPTFYNLSGNVSEAVCDPVTKELMEYNQMNALSNAENYRISMGDNYLIGVKTKNDYQYNSLFFKRVIPKDKGECLTGFRLVYMVKQY